MGSQNVANFARAHMDRIKKAVRPYSKEPLNAEQAWNVATEAVGPLTKSHPFITGLSSKGVENAIDLLLSLGDELRRAKSRQDVERILEKHNVDPKLKKPLLALTAETTKSFSTELTAQQQDSEFANTAKDAITKTMIDVLARSVPRDKVDGATSQQISRAFEKVDRRELGEIFFTNVFTSQVELALDASNISKSVREKFVKDLTADDGMATRVAEQLLDLTGGDPKKIPAALVRLIKRAEARERILNLEPKKGGDKIGGKAATKKKSSK